MDSELYDKVGRETWLFSEVIKGRLRQNLQTHVQTLNLPAHIAQQLITIAEASVDEGYHQAYPKFEQKLQEHVPPNNVPLLMERIPRRRHL